MAHLLLAVQKPGSSASAALCCTVMRDPLAPPSHCHPQEPKLQPCAAHAAETNFPKEATSHARSDLMSSIQCSLPMAPVLTKSPGLRWIVVLFTIHTAHLCSATLLDLLTIESMRTTAGIPLEQVRQVRWQK